MVHFYYFNSTQFNFTLADFPKTTSKLGLLAWCVASSIMFWSDDYDVVGCRTNKFTSHFFDFMLLDIVLGYVLIAKLFCDVCWMTLAKCLNKW